MAKKYRGRGRKAYRGGGYKSGGYSGRSQRSMSRGSRRGGGQTVRVVIQQQPHPSFYIPGQALPGAAAPGQPVVGFGAEGMMLGQPKGAPKKSKF